MAKRHYHQGQNIPGYLPESDVYTFGSKRAANASALSAARWLRDDGYAVFGSQGDYMAMRRPASDYDLGIHIWVSECIDSDCENDTESD